MSRFKQGHPKSGGRKKGVPNKKTTELLSTLAVLKLNPVHALAEVLPKLEPRDQAVVYLKLMEFIYPKRKAYEFTGVNDGPIQHETIQASIIDDDDSPDDQESDDIGKKTYTIHG